MFDFLHLILFLIIAYVLYENYKQRGNHQKIICDLVNSHLDENYQLRKEFLELKCYCLSIQKHTNYCQQQYEDTLIVKEKTESDQPKGKND